MFDWLWYLLYVPTEDEMVDPVINNARDPEPQPNCSRCHKPISKEDWSAAYKTYNQDHHLMNAMHMNCYLKVQRLETDRATPS